MQPDVSDPHEFFLSSNGDTEAGLTHPLNTDSFGSRLVLKEIHLSPTKDHAIKNEEENRKLTK